MKCEPQTAVAQPWDARINASLCEFRLEVGQDRRGSRRVLKAVNDAVEDMAAQLHPPLDTVDALAMEQVRRLLLIGRSEVMTEVVHHREREEPERQHGLDRVEMQGWEMVHAQARVCRTEVLHAPPFRGGRHGGVRSHGTGGRDQGEVRAVAALLQEHPQRAVDVGQGRRDGRHLAPDGLGIRFQRDGVKRPQAFGGRPDRGQDRDALWGVEVLDQLSAVPRFVCNEQEVPSTDGARQPGQPVGALGDGGARGGGEGNAGLL